MARGKYANVLPSLPKFMGSDASYQDQVKAVKQAILERFREENGFAPLAADLASEYVDLRILKDNQEAKLKEINLQIEAMAQLVAEQYENEGITTLRLAEGEAVSVQSEPYATVEDRDAFRVWCIENGLERSLMLPWQTTNALVKERLLKGEPEPPGVKSWAKDKIVMRKS